MFIDFCIPNRIFGSTGKKSLEKCGPEKKPKEIYQCLICGSGATVYISFIRSLNLGF